MELYHNSTITTITATTTDWDSFYELNFNQIADAFYGSVLCCLYFLIGTLGNIISFLYFKSKTRNISSVIYMLITTNDMVISLSILPVGISLWSKRRPGILFGNEYGCLVWAYLWHITVGLSIFLVICLSVTRTVSLLKPFKQQKVRYLIVAIVTYLVAMLAKLKSISEQAITLKWLPGCVLFADSSKNALTILGYLIYSVTCTVPVIVVAISCVISAVLLTRTNHLLQQRELQKTRNRATVTILLFSLVYGVCNVPCVVNIILRTIKTLNGNWEKFNRFDTQGYYRSIVNMLLIATNSAANPILYFWRMLRLREYIRRILRLNRANRIPQNNVNRPKEGPVNNVNQPEKGPVNNVNQTEEGPVDNVNQPKEGPVDNVNQPKEGPVNNVNQPKEGPVNNVNQPEKGPVNNVNQTEEGPVDNVNQPKEGPVDNVNQPEKGPVNNVNQIEEGPVNNVNQTEEGPVNNVNQTEEGPVNNVNQGEEGPVNNVNKPEEGPVNNVNQPKEGPVNNVNQTEEGPVNNVNQTEEGPVNNVNQGEEGPVNNVNQGEEGPVNNVIQGSNVTSDQSAALEICFK